MIEQETKWLVEKFPISAQVEQRLNKDRMIERKRESSSWQCE